MRLTRVAVWAAALILVGGMGVRVAHADGITNDPNIILHTVQGPGGGDPPSTTDGSSESDPLIITDATQTISFTYEGIDTPDYFVELVPSEGESNASFESKSFNCFDPAATPLTPVPPCGEVSPTQLPAVEFEFFGPFLNTDGSIQDDIVAGDTITFDVPEPNAMVLLVGGLCSALWMGLRRRQPSLS